MERLSTAGRPRAKKKAKTAKKKTVIKPAVKTPTWGELRSMAGEVARCIEKLSGRAFPMDSVRGAREHLSGESFYTLAFLQSISESDADQQPIMETT